jgi:TetR/AcrR family transcriptional regulator
MDSTRTQILAVASNIFYHKGFAGARMQEIADLVGLNKAMLHYYFKTKEQLFDTVFQEALGLFLDGIAKVLNAPLPLRQRIDDYVEYCHDALQANPAVAVFILHELHQHPDRLTARFADHSVANLQAFRQQAATIGANADHLFTNMVALCVYPFLAQPLLQRMLHLTDAEYHAFLQDRRQAVKKQIWAAI